MKDSSNTHASTKAALVLLGKGLRAEYNASCANTVHSDGLDAFIDDWQLAHLATAQLPAIKKILTSLSGYYAFDDAKRHDRLGHALTALLAEYTTLNATAETPSAPETPPPPVDTPVPVATVVTTPPDIPPTTVVHPVPPTIPPARSKPMTVAGTSGVSLTSALKVLPGVGPKTVQSFTRLGIRTLRDVLYHFPFRYEDRNKRVTIADLQIGEVHTVTATIVEVRSFSLRTGRKGVEVRLEDDSGILKATFFNQWLEKKFKPGQQIMVSGKVEQYMGMRQMSTPDWQYYHPDQVSDLLHVGRITPIYPLTASLSEQNARTIIKQVVDGFADQVVDPLPAAIRQRAGLIDLTTAIKHIHFPDTPEQIQVARTRLGFDEFLQIQLGVLQRKIAYQRDAGYAMPYKDAIHQAFLSKLPFALTNAQTRALGEIFADLQTTVPMARLLQGDVGSGKTAVAAATALQAVANGYQAAIMAPTEILAEQHYRGLRALLEPITVRNRSEWQQQVDTEQQARLAEIQLLLGMDPQRYDGVRVALLTGSLGARERRRVLEGIANGDVDLVVGTHALITDRVQYHRLGVAIVDEQHRFGVEQRQRLKDKGHNPHLLVMTATPIPRTLTMTIYGDLDTSVLDELPPGRQHIATKRIRPHERARAYKHIRKEIDAGRQAFVICPLVEESDKSDLPSAEEMYTKLQHEVFPDLRVALIHGQLASKDKDAVMTAFRNHEYDVLVATAVIEVGIDVPNATTIMIEGAERFGLAQLHQFRGRVGRGQYRSYCILVSDKDNEQTTRRLGAMEETRDGFRLAEIDLEIRGPGEFFGTRQSGTPDLKIAQLTDVRLLAAAQHEAKQILRADPELSHSEHALLREHMEAFWANAVEAN